MSVQQPQADLERPGLVDTRPLVDLGTQQLKIGLQEGEDFVVRSEPTAAKLVQWYGLLGGQVELEVTLRDGLFSREPLEALQLEVCKSSEKKGFVKVNVSRKVMVHICLVRVIILQYAYQCWCKLTRLVSGRQLWRRYRGGHARRWGWLCWTCRCTTFTSARCMRPSR